MNDPVRVAGDAGAAIIGQGQRGKDGHWDWRDLSQRSLEAAVASWVINILETDGHLITDLWSPDYDRQRDPARVTRPELAMTLDGEPAALDVTMFTTNDASWAGSRGTEIRKAIETRLKSVDDARSIFGVVGFDPAGLIALTKRDVRETSGAIADAFEAAIRSSPAAIDRLPIDILRPAVLRASVSATLARPGMSRVSIYVRAPRGDLASKVDAFILERMDKKAAQLRPWAAGSS